MTPGNQTQPLFWLNAITPDYFRVMNIRLVSGRAFTREDLTGRPAVAIVHGGDRDEVLAGAEPDRPPRPLRRRTALAHDRRASSLTFARST